MVYSKMDELYPVSDEVQKLYEEIFELLTPIMKSDDNDKYCILWIRPTPPTMEEYIAYWIEKIMRVKKSGWRHKRA